MKYLLVANFLLVSANAFAGVQGDPGLQENFVAVVEWKFSQSWMDESDHVVKLVNEPKSCAPYTKGRPPSDYSGLLGHGNGVANTFRLSHLKVLPLQLDLPDGEAGTELKLIRMRDVFKCLSDLASYPGFRGVNMSVAFSQARGETFDEELDRVAATVALKAREFLLSHPSLYLTLAVGNDLQRLESLSAYPASVLCVSEPLPNLFCVTGVWDDADGSIDHPLEIAFRSSNSPSLVALKKGRRDSATTSFLAPALLRRLTLAGSGRFEDRFVTIPSLDGKGSVTIRMRVFEVDE